MSKRRLLFVSTRFLFPIDSGGKIRTTQVLKGMKGEQFHITLVSPATADEQALYRAEVAEVCDEFECWDVPERTHYFDIVRLRHLFSHVPIPIRTDWHADGAKKISDLMSRSDVVVFDFLHAAILAPDALSIPSVLFTHNVEAEIFQRHIDKAANPFMRWLWKNQYKKMFDFEREALSRFDTVVAVSDRDEQKFQEDYGVSNTQCIPTGVDLDFFAYAPPSRFNDVVFCGSMDWLANQDAIDFCFNEIWPLVLAAKPDARLTIVGRSPPARLVEKSKSFGDSVTFTGFVDDVRPYLSGAGANIIPMRVAGGTRLKVYEAMSIGTPLVSTSIGVEGLPVDDGVHYKNADDPAGLAESIVQLLNHPEMALSFAQRARDLVEREFSYLNAARTFQAICDGASANGAR